MSTVGYGDIYPKSCPGKLIAMISSIMGMINLIIVVNVIGVNFRTSYRNIVLEKSKEAESERAMYIEKLVSQTSAKLYGRQSKNEMHINPGTGSCSCINNIRSQELQETEINQKQKF